MRGQLRGGSAGRGTGEGLGVDRRPLAARWGTVGQGEPRERADRGLDQVGSPEIDPGGGSDSG